MTTIPNRTSVARFAPALQVCAMLFALQCAPPAIAQPTGKGLFIELNDGTEIEDIAAVDNTSPGRPTGVQLHVCWSAIQSNPNDQLFYDWTQLATWLDAVEAHGLKAILRIDMIGGATKGAGDPIADPALSTPPWLFALNISYIGGQDLTGTLDPADFPSGSGKPYIPRLPWYGDAVYQSRVAAFAQELRYFLKGEPPYDEPIRHYSQLIECIRIGGWQANSNEPNFYIDYTNPKAGEDDEFVAWKKAVHAALLADLQAKGVAYGVDGKPVLDDASVYATASKTMVDGWIAAFAGSGIPLSTTVNLRLRECTADNEFLMYSLANGMIILNPGLNQKDKTMTRTYYANWKSTFGSKVGWGGVAGIGDLDVARVQAAFEGFGYLDLQNPPPLLACIADGGPFAAYRHDYLPLAGSSYAIFGMNILGNGLDNAFVCAREMIQLFADE